ncbi:prepilin-type N-terminal cleavage/methylation domain-containing protein [uncultured Phascolarctobacterium sp.]|uniref:prepilin-type N-terminal cleavage/methylation domain-containing protein n=1 Tax=uncultured Phascolarctobacterium sp. TaxID=512296 RepID=UPI0027D9B8FA|nr:prepilin-type N-terminal cleavage/methylation domain-containing protein [uncultured Phascolarctobacterium sp.]
MKKQSGFTLIELVVAMAVLGLIMGAMVHLFGSSVTSLHVGARQEAVYEEARLLMNELKTTLRYADKDSIDPEQPTVSTSKFSYKGNLWDRHMDIAQGTNKEYKVTVEWKDDTKKQLQVTREDITDGSKKITVFPNDSNNSIFEGKFPVTSETLTLNDGNTVIMYKIALPLQYEFNGQMKTQTLETKVVPSEEEVTETPEEKMLKEYTSLVSIWHKLKNGEVLTSSERNSLDDFKKFFGTSNDSLWQLGNNDKIREYLLSEKYGGAWFSVNINGKTVYMNPYGYGDTNVPITVDNVFLIGYTDPDKTTGWNVNYVYNPENKKWYHLIKNGGVSVSLPFNKVKDLINGSGWEIVGRS